MNSQPALRGIRVNIGMSLAALARCAEISRRQLQRIEAGECSPTIRVAVRLADALSNAGGRRYTVDELFVTT